MTKFSPLPSTLPAPTATQPVLLDRSVLIIDDSAACRMVEAAMAKALGARTETAETAVQAMAASATEAFDLIILDIGLADADGRVLARTLRETPNGRGAAILCVSGLGGQERAAGAINAGADSFAEKPFGSISAFGQAALGALRRRGEPMGSYQDDIEDEGAEDPLSPHVAACAVNDLSRGRGRMLKAVAEGDLTAACRAAHFISGVASLIRARSLEGAANALQGAGGDTGALRNIEKVLELALRAEQELKAAA